MYAEEHATGTMEVDIPASGSQFIHRH